MSTATSHRESSRPLPTSRSEKLIPEEADAQKNFSKASTRTPKHVPSVTSRPSRMSKRSSNRTPAGNSKSTADHLPERVPKNPSAENQLLRASSHHVSISEGSSRVPRTDSTRDTESEQEREERRKRRNRENARRTRERRKSERKVWQNVYDANEERIKELEKMVGELSGELRRHNTISSSRPASSSTSRSRRNNEIDCFEVKEDRPNWFGNAF